MISLFPNQVYVEAVNEHGTSLGSQRVVFRTATPVETNAEVEANVDLYNETACCVSVSFSRLFFSLKLSIISNSICNGIEYGKLEKFWRENFTNTIDLSMSELSFINQTFPSGRKYL